MKEAAVEQKTSKSIFFMIFSFRASRSAGNGASNSARMVESVAGGAFKNIIIFLSKQYLSSPSIARGVSSAPLCLKKIMKNTDLLHFQQFRINIRYFTGLETPKSPW